MSLVKGLWKARVKSSLPSWSKARVSAHDKEFHHSCCTAALFVSYGFRGHLKKHKSLHFIPLLFITSPQSCTTPQTVSTWLFVPEQREEHTVCYASALYGYNDRELFHIMNEHLFDISVLKCVWKNGLLDNFGRSLAHSSSFS